MKTLIKTDLYRFFKSKFFYMLLLIDVLLTVVLMGSFALGEFAVEQLTEMGIQMEAAQLLGTMMPQNFDQYAQMIFAGNFITLFLVIFVLIFCGNEYKNGYIKNIGSLVPKKHRIAFSKGIVVILAEVFFYLVTGIVLVCGCALQGRLTAEDPTAVVRIVGMSFLANLSLTGVVMMGFMLVRKTLPVLISAIVYIMLGGTVFQLLNLLIRVVTKNDRFDLNHFTNLGNLTSYITTDTAAGDTAIAAGIAVAFLIVGMAVSCASLNRKDIV